MNEYDAKEAAKLSGKGYSTVTKYCKLGTIGRVIGSRYILNDEDIAWLKVLPKRRPHTPESIEAIKAGNKAFRATRKGKQTMADAWEKRRFSKIKNKIKNDNK
jgi:hypothetical protein